MLASYHGHAPLVKLLLQHGADPNSLNDRGQSPLAGAVFKGESEVIEVSPLFGSCGKEKRSEGEEANETQALLDGGADPEFGQPSALEAVVLFKQEEQWREKFEGAKGRGKAGLEK